MISSIGLVCLASVIFLQVIQVKNFRNFIRENIGLSKLHQSPLKSTEPPVFYINLYYEIIHPPKSSGLDFWLRQRWGNFCLQRGTVPQIITTTITKKIPHRCTTYFFLWQKTDELHVCLWFSLCNSMIQRHK